MKTTLLKIILSVCVLTTAFISCKKNIESIQEASPGIDAVTTLNDSVRGVVFMANYNYDSSVLNCVDVRTGNKKWTFKTSGAFLTSGCSEQGVVFVGTTESLPAKHSTLFALQVSDGKIKWQHDYNYDARLTAIALYNHSLYIALGQNVVALNANNGRQLWKYQDPDNPYPIISSPTVANNTVYVYINSTLRALNATDGTLQWNHVSETNSYAKSSPCYLNGSIYYTAGDDNLHCLNAENGNENWKHFIGNSVQYDPFTNGEDKVFDAGYQFSPSLNYGIYCFNSITGEKLWRDSSAPYYPIAGNPAYFRQTIYYIEDDNYLTAIDANTGVQKWSTPLLTNPGCTITASPGVVFVTSFNTLYAVNIKTGETYWTFDFGPSDYLPYFAPFVVSNTGKAYYPTASGMNQ